MPEPFHVESVFGQSVAGKIASPPSGTPITIRYMIMNAAPMAGIITLDDGSDLFASNMGLSGALKRIADLIFDIDPELARWLHDVAQRGGGCMDFDLRGLVSANRAAFWTGVDRAYDSVADWDQAASFSPMVGVIRLCHGRRGVRGIISEERVQSIDLGELWFD